jgi:hypothetical protein
MMNLHHEDGVQKLLDIVGNTSIATRVRIEVLEALQDILAGKVAYDERIQELEMTLLRNPSFPDDLIGYWDDDFPDDEDDRQ